MADQNTGGDFSVRWSVDVDNVKGGSTDDSDSGTGKHHQHGIDQDGDVGDWFTVSIKIPHEIGDLNTYLAFLKGNDATWSIQPDPKHSDRVFFNVRIEKETPDQIRISWGKSGNVNRPPVTLGKKKNLLISSASRLFAKMAGRKKAPTKMKTTPKKKAKKATKKAGKKKR